VVKVRKLTPSNKRYKVVFLSSDDSETAFLVSEDLVVEYRLIPGKILEDFAFLSFKKAAEIDEVYQKALAYGIHYPQTVRGMISYLQKKAISPDAISSILQKLTILKILDDETYMKTYIEDHSQNRHEGVKKIAFDLKQKGIEGSLLAMGLNLISKKEENVNMNLLFDRKLSSLKIKPVKKALALMVQHLIQKGFDYEKAQAFVETREGLFGGNQGDEILIQHEVETLRKKRRPSSVSDKEFQEKAIRTLLNQGFSYSVVKKALERGKSDEN